LFFVSLASLPRSVDLALLVLAGAGRFSLDGTRGVK
jgi:hypothetical protein